MMKKVLFILIFFTSLYANDYDRFFYEYKNNNLIDACRIGKKIYTQRVERDEKLLSVIGNVCLKADYIDTVGTIQSRLRKTKEARINAVVFSAVVLQKRLIYQFMYDNTDISMFTLPVFNHPLSDTFVAIRDKEYKIISLNPKVIEFYKRDKFYKVYMDKDDDGRLVIETTDRYGNVKEHRYL